MFGKTSISTNYSITLVHLVYSENISMSTSKHVQFDCSRGGDSKCEVITCEGEDCEGMQFYENAKGCNKFLKLCPQCNAKLKSELDGNSISMCNSNGTYLSQDLIRTTILWRTLFQTAKVGRPTRSHKVYHLFI
jgi:hypothetical protein